MTNEKEIEWMAGHIIRRDVYALRQFINEPIASFLDIGANVGTTSIQARILFNRAKIVALEPGPEAFKRLSWFVPWFIECHQIALGDGSDLCFHDRGRLGTNRMYHKSEPWWMEDAPKIKSMTLPTMMDAFKITAPYIIKVDCEGGERFILNDPAAVPIVSKSRYFTLEVHLGFGGEIDKWNQWFAQFEATHQLREIEQSNDTAVYHDIKALTRHGRYEVCLISR